MKLQRPYKMVSFIKFAMGATARPVPPAIHDYISSSYNTPCNYSYYYSQSNDFTLIIGDMIETPFKYFEMDNGEKDSPIVIINVKCFENRQVAFEISMGLLRRLMPNVVDEGQINKVFYTAMVIFLYMAISGSSNSNDKDNDLELPMQYLEMPPREFSKFEPVLSAIMRQRYAEDAHSALVHSLNEIPEDDKRMIMKSVNKFVLKSEL